jgi:hypothetical protein
MARRDIRYALRSQLAATDASILALNLDDLADVNVTTPTDTYLLQWDDGAGEFNLVAPSGGGASQLSDLSDVNTSTPTNRFVLVADGVDYEARLLVEADISDLGSYLTSVAVTDLDNGTDGELLTWDAAGAAATVAVGTSGHVLTSNGVGAAPTFQAAAGGGPSNWIDNGLGGDGQYNSVTAIEVISRGVTITDAGGTNSPYINFNDDTVDTFRLIYAGASGGFFFDSFAAGEDIHFRLSSTAGARDSTMLKLVEQGGVELTWINELAFATEATGIAVYDGVSGQDDPNVVLRAEAGTQLGALGVFNGNMTIQSNTHAGELRLRAEDTGGTLQYVFLGDPDGVASLYNAGIISIGTTGSGMRLYDGTGNAPLLQFYEDDEATRAGFIQFRDATYSRIVSEEHGLELRLQAQDISGTVKDILLGDGDASTILFDVGIQVFSTHSGGINIYDTNGDDPFIGFYDQDLSTRLGFIQNNTTGFTLTNEVDSAHVTLKGKTAASASKTGFTFDPDVGVGFFQTSAFAPPTYVANATAVIDRTLLASASATTTNNNNVLAALIADLKSYGLAV